MADGKDNDDDNTGGRVHILVVTYPGQGHINPMLQFSKRLLHKGAAVTFVVTNSLLKNKPMADVPPFPVETISDGYEDGEVFSFKSFDAYHERLERVGSQSLRDLLRRLSSSGRRVDCVAYDGFLPWVLDIAKEFELKAALYFTQSCAVDNIYYHVYSGDIKLPLPEGEIHVPGLPPLKPSDMPSFVQDRNSYPGFFELLTNQFRNIEKADWVLCNTFHELEEEVLEWMGKKWAMKTIGPNIPSMYTDGRIEGDREYGFSFYSPKSEVCRQWLAGRPKSSVVFVAFGSFAALSVEQMEELAWGLRQSNSSFLWVVRAMEGEKVPEKFAEETGEKGLLVSWCPQLEVLSHDAVGCFVTHCGWNSTVEALSMGVPMVAMPQWTDQTTNAKCIMDIWKTGLRPPVDHTGIVRREALADCIVEIMEGDGGKEIRRNAAKWGALAKQAVDHGGSSDTNVDHILAQLASTFN